MNLRTCISPAGRFVFGIHTPKFLCRNFRSRDEKTNLGISEEGQLIRNSRNFPSNDIAPQRGDQVFEVPNPFPFRGTTYINRRWADARAIKPEEMLDLISETTVLVGDGLLSYGDYLKRELGNRLVLTPPHLSVIQASSVAWLGWHRLRSGESEDVYTCTPLYIRPSEAELNRKSSTF